MKTEAGRVVMVGIRLYLSAFAYFAPNFRAVREEHSLIEGSIDEAAEELERSGRGSRKALAIALWHHVGELDPRALAVKTWTDARASSRVGASRHWYVLRLALVATVAATATFLAYPSPDLNSWARADGDHSAPAIAGQAGSLRELLYLATGVCIDADVADADLTDDLVRDGSPGADCSDLD